MTAIYGIAGDTRSEVSTSMGARLDHHGFMGCEHEAMSAVRIGARGNSASHAFAEIGHLSIIIDASIYNPDQLREAISRERLGLDPADDAELILAAYHCFGTKAFPRINGDYAVAIADRNRGTLLLARDPLGSRPLYYWHSRDTVLFASEYKAILACPRVRAEPNYQALEYFVRSKYLPAAASLIDGISAVPPGHWIEFAVQGAFHEVGRHWAPEMIGSSRDEQAHTTRIREQLLSAVRRRVEGLDVVGANLSGGVDAASIVAAIREVRPELEIHTYTAGHGSDDHDVRGAEPVARHFDTRHHLVEVQPECIPDRLPEVIWRLEDPIGRSEVLHNNEMAMTAANHVSVVLGGYGADVIFGGSPKDKVIRLMQWLPTLKTPLGEFYNYTQVSEEPRSRTGRLLKAVYFHNNDPGPASLNIPEIQPITTPLPAAQPEAINHVLMQNLREPGWLQKDVRLHPSAGLEIRAPFLDVQMIKTAFAIPDALKINRWQEKYILREALRPLLPPEVLQRPKYPHRMKSDLRMSQVLEEYGRAVLHEQAIRDRAFFDYEDVDRILRRPSNRAYTFSHAMRIWTLVVTELWAQIFLDHRGDLHRARRSLTGR